MYNIIITYGTQYTSVVQHNMSKYVSAFMEIVGKENNEIIILNTRFQELWLLTCLSLLTFNRGKDGSSYLLWISKVYNLLEWKHYFLMKSLPERCLPNTYLLCVIDAFPVFCSTINSGIVESSPPASWNLTFLFTYVTKSWSLVKTSLF